MKQYTFWKIVKKEVREECCIKANSLDEATEIHNRDGVDYKEVHCFNDEIIDEGTDEGTDESKCDCCKDSQDHETHYWNENICEIEEDYIMPDEYGCVCYRCFEDLKQQGKITFKENK